MTARGLAAWLLARAAVALPLYEDDLHVGPAYRRLVPPRLASDAREDLALSSWAFLAAACMADNALEIALHEWRFHMLPARAQEPVTTVLQELPPLVSWVLGRVPSSTSPAPSRPAGEQLAFPFLHGAP